MGNYKPTLKLAQKGHVKLVHDKIRRFACEHCDYKAAQKGTLKSHVKFIHSKIRDFACEQCDYKATAKGTLKRHVKTKHRVYTCEPCNYKTSHRKMWKSHVKVHHEKKRYFHCEHCDYVTANKKVLGNHVRVVHNKRFECIQCPFKTAFKSVLGQHVKGIHEGINEFQCEECNFKTSRKEYLQSHIKRHNFSEQQGTSMKIGKQCNQCNYKTAQNWRLARHIKSTHDKIRDHACEQCDYKSSRKDHLVKHIKVAHRNSQYKNNDVADHSNYKNTLNQHVKTAHEQMRDSPSPQCGHKAVRNCDIVKVTHDNLKKHRKGIHKMSHYYRTGFKFYLQSRNKWDQPEIDHLKWHLDDVKEFSCMECDYKAPTGCELQEHVEKDHEKCICGECDNDEPKAGIVQGDTEAADKKTQDLSCAICDYRTSKGGCLQIHMRSQHDKHV